MKKAVTFGEIMLRLQPPSYERFLQAGSFDAVYGGGEANVAVSLSQLGAEAKFVTRLPANPLGFACRNQLRGWGVDTSDIVFGGDRIGIYFCEKGASQRPSNVIYDRAGSSAATATRADYDWERILDGASWFHFTGITPALGGENPAIVFDACETAKRKGVTVSCDLNYRKKLWTRERAREAMEKLCGYVDVLIANEEDSADVFGIRAGGSDIEGGRLSAEGYADVARQLKNTAVGRVHAIHSQRARALAGVGERVQAVDAGRQRGLAAAGRPGDQHALPGVDVQIDVMQRGLLLGAILERKIFKGYDRGSRFSHTAPRRGNCGGTAKCLPAFVGRHTGLTADHSLSREPFLAMVLVSDFGMMRLTLYLGVPPLMDFGSQTFA